MGGGAGARKVRISSPRRAAKPTLALRLAPVVLGLSTARGSRGASAGAPPALRVPAPLQPKGVPETSADVESNDSVELHLSAADAHTVFFLIRGTATAPQPLTGALEAMAFHKHMDAKQAVLPQACLYRLPQSKCSVPAITFTLCAKHSRFIHF